jgi:hypothetical protein
LRSTGTPPDQRRARLRRAAPRTWSPTPTSAHKKRPGPRCCACSGRAASRPLRRLTRPATCRQGRCTGCSPSIAGPFTELSYEELLAEQYPVVGSPGTVTKRLTEMHDRLGGLGQIIGRFAIGPRARQQTRRSAEPLATEMMPAIWQLGAL